MYALGIMGVGGGMIVGELTRYTFEPTGKSDM
jgi:hypothetical protein